MMWPHNGTSTTPQQVKKKKRKKKKPKFVFCRRPPHGLQFSGLSSLGQPDQYQYLGNCPPTPPLTQQQSIDNKLRLMLG